MRGGVPQRQSLTIRLPGSAVDDLRAAARGRGISMSDVVEFVLTGRDVRPSRTRAAVDAEPWTALGYRLARAIAALDAGDVDVVRGELLAARVIVVDSLTATRGAYDAALDGRLVAEDDWSGTRT
jgi:hypothetical protein